MSGVAAAWTCAGCWSGTCAGVWSASTSPPGCCAPCAVLHPDRLRLVRGDVQHLPLRTGSVDVALAMHMLYHVPDRRAAVAELRRIVRPSGTLLASTNATDTLAEIWRLFDEAVAEQLGRPVRTAPALGSPPSTERPT